MAGAWKEKRTFLAPNSITHKVGDTDYQFYSISLGMMFKLKCVAEPVAKAVALLFTKRDQDYGVIQRNIGADKDGANGGTEIINEAVSVPIAELRAKQQKEAIENLMQAFLVPEHLAVLGEIIMDSMRDEFPKGHADTPPAQEFIKEVPLPVMTQMVMGVVEANKEVLGPLAGKLQGSLETAVASVKAKADTVANAKSTKVAPLQG